MTTREMIHAEIDRIREEELGELHQLIRSFVETRAPNLRKPGLLAKLQQIKIQGPEDFASNLDLYLSGEKSLADDQDVH